MGLESSKKIILHYQGDFNQRLFDPGSRDNCCEPFLLLKEELGKRGYTIEIPANQAIEDCETILYWDSITLPFSATQFSLSKTYLKILVKAGIRFFKGVSSRNWVKEAIQNGQQNKLVLLLWEGKVVCPGNFDQRLYKLFSRILTWDDSLVDEKRFYKLFLPSPEQMPSVPSITFSSKKLLVNISYYKTSAGASELYSERLKSIRYFEKHKPEEFDLYGFGWDQLVNTKQAFTSYRGVVKNKWEVLPKYKFAICYENNHSQPGYITEKIFDCLRADCVPVYWGAPNIEAYVNPDCFIDRRKFESNEELDAYLSGLTESDYEKFREAGRKYLQTDQFKQFLSPAFVETFVRVVCGAEG